MTALLITIGIILLLIGLAGALIPGLPGPPFSYLALIVLHLGERYSFSEEFLVVMAIIMVIIVVLDYVVPVYGTKKFGGSKRGVWGSTIGLIAGLFILPALGLVIGPFGLIGIILGPFIGAYIGEISGGKDSDTALKAAIGSFIGFLAGTFIKLAYAIVTGVYFFIEVFA
jgi:uncharacterized protein YqgC (DUF456 family)